MQAAFFSIKTLLVTMFCSIHFRAHCFLGPGSEHHLRKTHKTEKNLLLHSLSMWRKAFEVLGEALEAYVGCICGLCGKHLRTVWEAFEVFGGII